MEDNYVTQFNEEAKTIVTCEQCLQKIRIPRRKKKIHVTCPICRNRFLYQYYGLGLSSVHKKPLLVGLIGSLVGMLIIEYAINSQFFYKTNPLVYVMAVFGIFGICLGAALGTAEGLFKDHQYSIRQGFKVGTLSGLVIGMISGSFAQLIFLKDEVVANREDSRVGSIFLFSGILVFIAGMFLVAGNLTGLFPTFPFAGFFTTGLGSMMITAGLKMR